MNDPIDLTQFEPSWRGYPPVPSRMSDGGFTSEKYRPAEIHDVETGTPPVVGFEDAPRSVAGGGLAPETGAFYGRYVEDGDTFLQGGTVVGSNGGSVTIADEDVTTGAAGTVLYLKASCEATVTDGIMLPGCKLLTAGTELTTIGGDNHSFTTASDTGFLYYEVGRWNAAGFAPSGMGNLVASGCIGSFGISRV